DVADAPAAAVEVHDDRQHCLCGWRVQPGRDLTRRARDRQILDTSDLDGPSEGAECLDELPGFLDADVADAAVAALLHGRQQQLDVGIEGHPDSLSTRLCAEGSGLLPSPWVVGIAARRPHKIDHEEDLAWYLVAGDFG